MQSPSRTNHPLIVPSSQYQYPGESDKHFRQRCRRGYVNRAEAYHLFRFTWQIFGHVTFAQLEISRHKRLSMVFATIASTFGGHGLEFKKAVWVRCEELGKLGRAVPHIHFLIAAIPRHIDVGKFCQRMRAEWRRVGGGLHKITRYDPHLEGAGYLAKCAGGFNGSTRENSELTFSPTALAHLKRMAERGPLARGAKLCAS
jgi:hypothetical protein